MEPGIRLYLAELSLSNTVRKLEKSGDERSRKAVHDWVHKCDLQPAVDVTLNHVAPDETTIQIDKYHYWLYIAVDPETNKIPVRGSIQRLQPLWQSDSCRNSLRNMISMTPYFSSIEQNICRLHFVDMNSGFDTKNMEIGTLLNVSFVS